MRDLLTPKQVARAIQVSESSVKRWCDRGVIQTQYTAGGHRRIPISGLLKFLRESKHELVEPDVLGLPATSGTSERVVSRAADNLMESLIRGDSERCRQIIIDLYLAEHSLSTICDLVFSPAFREIGDRWECGKAQVYQERLGCEIALRILHELRALIPTGTAVNAPVAIGGSVEGDQYNLATTMVELVLRDAKWNATSLGVNLPFDTLAAAIEQRRPRMFWLSVSHMSSVEDFLRGYDQLYDAYGMRVAFVVGGRALAEPIRHRMKYAAYCDNMRHLEAFAQTLRDSNVADFASQGH